ncbi:MULTISPECIES: hypothetical protein [Pseudomonas]|uniref:Glycosyl hydrolase n=1 Tax=Pseudomonas quebecensis TaxID=2995174 RepID=A0ABY6Q9D2_9PSED|nr:MULTISPECIES: hypothetical protein [Pseudomonas]MCP1510629.1 hypothetical protein [Pseudomonas rhodesiae]MCX4066932.1 hypothetical protein [Pseudomonas quebecensis]MDF9769442.1 hypothetical protein [Pseudomonas rhodesiae]UZW16582.1 hypothetical protein OSC50_14355 [Pseudomonas quebecensis]UZW26004.1 hypothetical protein OSC48_11125 [Pseudomonas quebecensis]
MPRSTLIARLVVALLIGAALWYIWIITSAKLGIGGASPDQQQIGVLPGLSPRHVSESCTGVVVTRQGTWLLGRVEDEYHTFTPSPGQVNLNEQLYGKTPKAQEEEGGYSGFFPRDKPETTFVSRLDADGAFKPVAQVSGTACLVSSADGERVFLLTDLKRPKEAEGQEVVFRSDDQGKTWTWLAEGFFPELGGVLTQLAPYFYSQNEVWAWRNPDEIEEEGRSVQTGVSYSLDGGQHSTPIATPHSLVVGPEFVSSQHPQIKEWHDSNDQVTHVLQLDARRAYIWVSQRFWASNPDGKGDNLAFSVTTRVELSRAAGAWQVGAVQREEGLYINDLANNGDGRVLGLIDQGPHGHAVVAEMNTTTLAWQPLGEVPSVFSPLASSTQAQQLWVGRNSLMINTYSEHRPPRWLYWWGDANISAGAVFYSKDWGQSWKRLAVDGYRGVIGFDGAGDRVFWAKESHLYDVGIQAYGL